MMASEETVLHGITDRLTEVGMCYGIEINVKKPQGIKDHKTIIPVHIIEQKLFENAECFKYLGSMITNDTRYTREIKSRISMAKLH